MPNLPTRDELELIAFAAGERDKYRPMISTADAGSDCPSFERLAEIIAAQADKIETAQAVENTLDGELKARDDTIEWLTKERDEARKQFALDAKQAQQQIDATAAQRVQMKDLQGRLWSVRESRDHARKQRDDARAEVEQQRKQIGGLTYHLDAARAEVERLMGLAHLREEEAMATQSARVSEDQRKIRDMSSKRRELIRGDES